MESLDNNSMDRMQILPIHQRWKMLMMGVSLSLVGQISGIMQAIKVNGLLDRIRSGDTGAGYEIVRMSQEPDPVALLSGLASILAIVFVCMWFYRAGQNIHLAGMKYLNYTPGWYVGWFFIPLVQLVMPFITTIELWKASSSINNQEEYSTWNSNKVSPLVMLWYFAFIAAMVIVCYIMFSNFDNLRRITFDPEAAIDSYANMSKMAFFTVPLQTISGICLILFSKKITEMQTNYINE